jgi:Protein of unknown function (DUF3768)
VIAALNDLCRTAMGVAGRIVQTPGICVLPPADHNRRFAKRPSPFDFFTPDNDPYHEHDFGSFEHNGERIFLEHCCRLIGQGERWSGE